MTMTFTVEFTDHRDLEPLARWIGLFFEQPVKARRAPQAAAKRAEPGRDEAAERDLRALKAQLADLEKRIRKPVTVSRRTVTETRTRPAT